MVIGIGDHRVHKRNEPAWWMLYALAPVMGGLLVIESRIPLSLAWHKSIQSIQLGIILVVYGLIWAWVQANDFALLRHRQGRCRDENRIATSSDDSPSIGHPV
jgi:uncharacterized membrane protein YhaH (DUF805 family)